MGTPGDVVDDRYLVGELLGRGGMADVFRATDLASEDVVAVKFLRSVEPGSDRRFAGEAEVLARLDHPGMVRLRGSGTHAGVPYLVLDLADGGSLARDLSAGPVGLDRALDVGEQVAGALGCAHRLGVVHRDVKPSNILFDDRGRVRLADFGIARLAGSPDLTCTGHLIGSAPYLAPEQAAGERVGPAADVYALGLVVIECVTGRPCYGGGAVEAAVARLQRQPDVPQCLPAWSRTVLSAMTARDPARRPPADAVAEALRDRSDDPVLPSTALHDLRAIEAHRREAAPPGPATATATLTVTRLDPAAVRAEIPGTADEPDRSDRTAVFASGSRARPGVARGRWGRVRVLAAMAALGLAALGLVAGVPDGERAPAPGPGDAPLDTSTTSTVPTTVTTTAPAPAEAPPGPGPRDRPGNGRGRANGNGNGDKDD